MSGKMSMMFSQSSVMGFKGAIIGKTTKSTNHVVRLSAPVPVVGQVKSVARSAMNGTTTRSAPKSVKQLFSLGHIMANPGTPCKACGS